MLNYYNFCYKGQINFGIGVYGVMIAIYFMTCTHIAVNLILQDFFDYYFVLANFGSERSLKVKRVLKAIPEIDFFITASICASVLSHIIATEYNITEKTYELKAQRDGLFGQNQYSIWIVGHFCAFLLMFWGAYIWITTIVFSFCLKKKHTKERYQKLRNVLIAF